jgi:hypothetical protein
MNVVTVTGIILRQNLAFMPRKLQHPTAAKYLKSLSLNIVAFSASFDIISS